MQMDLIAIPKLLKSSCSGLSAVQMNDLAYAALKRLEYGTGEYFGSFVLLGVIVAMGIMPWTNGTHDTAN
jgi:hypothetical protein